MSTHYLWRSRPQKAILTLALSGVGSWAVTSYFTRNAFADDGEPATVFPSKLGTSLRLESSESVNHNTKRLRFEFPNPTARSGLTLTCTFPFPDMASI
jgi:cytochrome-b5 reductase